MRVSAVHARVVVMLVVLTHVRCVACDFDVCALQLRTSLWRCLPSRRCLWPLYGSRIKFNPSIFKDLLHTRHIDSKVCCTPCLVDMASQQQHI